MQISCIGAGALGRSWVALFLAKGFPVRVFDPSDGWLGAVRQEVADAADVLGELGFEHVGDTEKLSAAASVEEAVKDADFVQESGPENLSLKQNLLAEIERFALPKAIIASSTSGLLPSDLAKHLKNPSRFVVAHPFDPPHIIPLVELIASPETDPRCIEKAVALFTELKKATLVVRGETPGFIANRLQAAMAREAFHMVAAGEATMAEIDYAICNGPGLRWPDTGPCEGEISWIAPDGPTHIHKERYDALMTSDWSRLKGPELTPEFEAELLKQIKERLAAPKPMDTVLANKRILGVMMAVDSENHRVQYRNPSV